MRGVVLTAQRRAHAVARAAWSTPPLRVATSLAGLAVAIFLLYERFSPQSAGPCTTDFASYYHSALLLARGQSPYAALAHWIRQSAPTGSLDPFTATSCLTGPFEFSYTPFFALLLVPFTWLPYAAALALWDACNVLLLAGAIYAFLRAARHSPTVPWLLLFTGLAMVTAPLRFELYYAQADIVLLFLVCAALWARSTGHATWAGLLLAVACASAPALLAATIFLVWKREFRFAAVTVATAAVLILAPFLWLGAPAFGDLLTVWGFYAGRYAVVFTNDAPHGLLLRLLAPNPYLTPLVNAPWLATALWLLLAAGVMVTTLRLLAPRPLADDTRSLLDVGLIVAALLLMSLWAENSQFTLLVIPFLAVAVALHRLGWQSPATRRLRWGFAAAVLLAILFGDPEQYALVARMSGHTPLAYLYALLAVPCLYLLLVITALGLSARRHIAAAPLTPPADRPVPDRAARSPDRSASARSPRAPGSR